MPENIEASCHNCAYERDGTCHRYPPTIQHIQVPRDGDEEPRTDTEVTWPTIDVYEGTISWCSEWKHPGDLIKVTLANGS